MGFDVSNGAARPAAVGEIPGYLLNQYALDCYKMHFCAAITLSKRWSRIDGEIVLGYSRWKNRSASIQCTMVVYCKVST